ncbi:MAG: S8 family serine peptidase [Acidobacteriaceae bacterium]|nr:S8 family serine peptidase [Acidobacteriaceae bacterium]
MASQVVPKMGLFELIGLVPLAQRTSGRPEITVGLVDGPIAFDHPDLAGQRIREIAASVPARCVDRGSAACAHGTFVAGILAAKRRSVAPAICPNCTFLLRPIFSETSSLHQGTPATTSEELAAAIIDSVEAGVRILNLSVNVTGASRKGESRLADAFEFAASRGVLPVASAANQGGYTASMLTRHPWVLPVLATDYMGRPLPNSEFSAVVGRRGIAAPGKGIVSLGTNDEPCSLSGTSAATAVVTGSIALLWSELPDARAAEVRFVVANPSSRRRSSLVPPMLNAWSAFQALAKTSAHRAFVN